MLDNIDNHFFLFYTTHLTHIHLWTQSTDIYWVPMKSQALLWMLWKEQWVRQTICAFTLGGETGNKI